MIVQCPQCSSQYRVQDDKIPASGGRITCPNCNNSFVVHPDDSQSQQQDYGEDKTSVTDTDQLQNRLAQMAEGMEGEDVDEADPGDVDPTEVMQGPNVPDFMDEDAGPGEGERDKEGTREMKNPYADDGGGGVGAGEQTTQDVESDDLLSDAVDDATEVWEGADSMDAMSSESGPDDGSAGPETAPADHSADTFDAQREQRSVSEGSQSSGPSSGPPGGGAPGRNETELGTGAVDESASSPGVAGGGQQPQGGRPSAQSGGTGPSGDHDGPWKLKGDHGLTYEFPETDALRNWLTDREGIADFELSADGGSTFHDLGDFPQVADLIGGGGGGDPAGSQQISSRGQGGGAPAGGAPAGGGGAPGSGPSNRPGGNPGGGPANQPDGGAASSQSGQMPASSGPPRGNRGPAADQSGNQPTSGPAGGPDWDDALEDGVDGGIEPADPPQKVANDGFELPSRDAVWHKVLYGILFVLIVLATGVFLEVAQIYPVGRYIPGVPTTFDTDDESGGPTFGGGTDDSTTTQGGDESGDDEQGGAEDEKIKQIITAAEESIENNRLQTAIEKLQAAKVLDPKRPRTYELLGEVYEKIGQDDKADKNRRKAKELQGDEAGEAVTQKDDEKKEEVDEEKKGEESGEAQN